MTGTNISRDAALSCAKSRIMLVLGLSMKRNLRVADSGGKTGRLRRVEGRHNVLVKELRRAFRQGQPTIDGYFAIEGVRMIDEAIRSGSHLRAIFFSDSAVPRMSHLVPQISASTEALVLPDLLFESAVLTEAPQGVAALVRLALRASVDSIAARAMLGPIMVTAGIQDPGNLGTLLRSAEAFGAGGILFGEGTVSEWNPKTVRASAGSIFRIPGARAKLAESILALRGAHCRLFATSSHKGTPLWNAKLTPPLAVFVGNEGAGIPKETLHRIDEIIAIPQAPSVESINAGVAASIVLYESARQRGQGLP
jgi:RNA methyltransferase, TrmH family